MKKIITILTILSLLTVTLVGCNSNSQSSSMVSTDGSTSMNELIGYLSESYMEDNKNVKVTYNPTGSSSGIKAVQENRCDIGLASRDLKADEQKDLVQTVIAIDGIAMIINPQNTITDLTIEQIASIYKGEIKNWNELGGNDSPIVLIGREASSGTRDGFESITETKDACKYSQELTSTGDVIQTVSSNPNAIGYASLSAIKDSVKVLSIEGIKPTTETIQNGTYKLQRNFIFVTKKNTKLSPEAQAFYNYATSDKADALIIKAGAVPTIK